MTVLTVDEEIEQELEEERRKRSNLLTWGSTTLLWGSDTAKELKKSFQALFTYSGDSMRSDLQKVLAECYVEDAGTLGLREELGDLFFKQITRRGMISHEELMTTPPSLIDTSVDDMTTALSKAWSLHAQDLFQELVGEWIDLLDGLDEPPNSLVVIPVPEANATVERLMAAWRRWEGKSGWVLEVPEIVTCFLVRDCKGEILPYPKTAPLDTVVTTFLDLATPVEGSIPTNAAKAFESAELICCR